MQARHLVAVADARLDTQRHFKAVRCDVVDVGFGYVASGASPGGAFDEAVFEIANLLD
ncbi:hypothetical protein D3C87_1365240 [compost metagenome]